MTGVLEDPYRYVATAASVPRVRDEVSVVLVDHHPVFREGLRNLLEGEDGLRVVGEASSTERGVAVCVDTVPHVILLGVHDDEGAGFDGIEPLRSAVPGCEVVVITTSAEDASVRQALASGARGYLLTSAEPQHVVRAIWAASEGHAMLTPSVAERLPDLLQGSPESGRAFPQLTDREFQILELAADGHTPDSIARKLRLKEKTIRNNLSAIYAKLHVVDRAQAVLRARAEGLGRPLPEAGQ